MICALSTGCGSQKVKFGLDDARARQVVLSCASAPLVLFEPEIALTPGARTAVLARLTCGPSVHAVGARLVRPHRVPSSEAAGIIWRDGQRQPYAEDASPLPAEANFVRDMDFCFTQLLLARRAAIVNLLGQADGLSGTTFDAADVCADSDLFWRSRMRWFRWRSRDRGL